MNTFEGNVEGSWRALLACRKCKAALTRYLAREFLTLAPAYMPTGEERELVVNIKNSAYICTKDGNIIERPTLYTNTEEADQRIWLHCVHSTSSRILIFSPDTDVYHVGLVHMEKMPGKDIVVQLSRSLLDPAKAKLLHLTALVASLNGDPDLADIPMCNRPQALQSVFVSTGCDYVSYFAGIGKCSFLKTFFQYASFIAGGPPMHPPGSLGFILPQDSFCSFVRLVGCAYFMKNASAFEHCTPVALFNAAKQADNSERHKSWLDMIRRRVWMRADLERNNLPTLDALKLHWRRSLWVLGLWHSATGNDIELPGRTQNDF